ncbi:MAG: NAD(P)/FAD-dependent oxidoreductase [Acidobacteriota bacterium]
MAASDAPFQPRLIVVGGGIAGSAVVLRAGQYHLPTLWLRGDRRTRRASRAAYVRNIDNMIGVHPWMVRDKVVALLQESHPEAARRVAEAHLHISAEDLIDNARARVEKQFPSWVQFRDVRAVKAARVEAGFQVEGGDGSTWVAPFLVLATGVMDRQPVIHKVKGEKSQAGIHWVFPYANRETLLYCIRCEGHLTAGQRLAVLGSGPAAAHVALMARERYGIQVSVLTTGEPRTWSDPLQARLDQAGVQVLDGCLRDIEGEARGDQLRGFLFADGSRISVDLALVAMGLHRVYNDLARQLGAELESSPEPEDLRHVLISAEGETSVANLFAVGDMTREATRPIMKQIYTAQEYAVRAVDTIDRRRRLEAGGPDGTGR